MSEQPKGDRQAHWESVYSGKDETGVSWFEEEPFLSLELIRLAGAGPDSGLVDIGGGASRLVDHLIASGFRDVTVLDLSSAALANARARLGEKAKAAAWIQADVTRWTPARTYDVWHDRAALHFLTDRVDQQAYAACLRSALRPGGHAIIGTFAPDGPEKCSGLPVVRHDAQSLGDLLGDAFKLVETRPQVHRTPWGSEQKFRFSVFRYEP